MIKLSGIDVPYTLAPGTISIALDTDQTRSNVTYMAQLQDPLFYDIQAISLNTIKEQQSISKIRRIFVR